MDITINPKRRKTEKAPVNEENINGDGADIDGIDRISDLPNELRCRILSFLPTKHAVGTTILSTKWKNLLPLTPNLRLRLDDSLLLHPESAANTDLTSFAEFANNLLNVTLRDAPPIYSFALICKRFNDGHIIANWISSALQLNIKRMEIRIRRPQNYRFLLDSLYGCNIVFLHLLLDFGDDATEFRFSLPKLKLLYVQCMRFRPVNVLLASCPSLEYLMLHNCLCNAGETLQIRIPSLKALILYSYIYRLDCVIELDAPQLFYLNHSGYLYVRYLWLKRKSPLLARLDLEDEIGQLYPLDPDQRVAELVKLCSGVEKLWLSERIISILYQRPHHLPRFQKLVELAIRMIIIHGWELLPSLLACAPNLKNLYLKSGFDMDWYERLKAKVKDSMSICLFRCTEECFQLVIERKAKK